VACVSDEEQAGIEFRGVDPAGYLDGDEEQKENYIPWGDNTRPTADEMDILGDVGDMRVGMRSLWWGEWSVL
jgi:hypothetical protein